jgi:hypothetical protein
MPLLARLEDEWLAPHLRRPDVRELDLAERAARFVASHCYWAAQQAGLTVVDYADLGALIEDALPAFFGLRPTPDDRRRLSEQLRVDAKEPGRTFVPDAAAKQREATDRIRALADEIIGPELKAVLARHPRLGTASRSA